MGIEAILKSLQEAKGESESGIRPTNGNTILSKGRRGTSARRKTRKKV